MANDQDLIGGQPGTRQDGFQHGLLPLQQALGLQVAERNLQPQEREFTHTATSGSSSARIDRWLVTDSLLPNVSATLVSDIRPSDHYGVSSFSLFFFGRERYSLHECNDNNLKESLT